MNKKKLRKLKGWVRVHPKPKMFIKSNVDEQSLWFVEEVTDAHIRLSYPTTGHVKDIGLDHFIEYRTDSFVHMGRAIKGILIFKSQITVRENRVILEPLIKPPFIPKTFL